MTSGSAACTFATSRRIRSASAGIAVAARLQQFRRARRIAHRHHEDAIALRDRARWSPDRTACGAVGRTRDRGSKFARSRPGTAPPAAARARRPFPTPAGGRRAVRAAATRPPEPPLPASSHRRRRPDSAARRDRPARDNSPARPRPFRSEPPPRCRRSSSRSSSTHGRNRASSRTSSPVSAIRRHTTARPSSSAHTDTIPGVGSQPHSHSSSVCREAGPASFIIVSVVTGRSEVHDGIRPRFTHSCWMCFVQVLPPRLAPGYRF